MVFAYHCMATAWWPTFGDVELKWHGWIRDYDAPAGFLAFLPLTLGWCGVSIFFVVSGFCIHLSHQRSREKNWKTFFLRRFFRIYPPYLAALLFFALIFPWSKLAFTARILHVHAEWFYSLVQLGVHLLLVHNFDAVSLKGINPAFWSIAVEVQLYLLYPLLLYIIKKRGVRAALWMTGTLEIGLRSVEAVLITLHPDRTIPTWFADEPCMFWFSWAIGAALAEAYLRGRAAPFRHALWLWPLLLLVCYNVKPLACFCFTLAALATAAVISRLLIRRDMAPSRGPRWLSRHFRFAGTVSYSAYLIHMPLLYMVPDLMLHLFPQHPLSAPTLVVVCLMTWFPVLILSRMMFRLVELPSIAAGKRVDELTRGLAG